MAVVLITGCSSGIGMATAAAFANRGHRVVATMRKPGDAAPLREAASGAALDVLAMDVTSDDSVAAAVETVLAECGRIDVLVNNAGVARYGVIERIPWDWAREMFETNFWGALRTARAVLPVMRAQGGGTIVNVSSVAARLPGVPVAGLYAASKHALSSASEALALEAGPLGVRVVLIEPGWYQTSALKNAKTVDDPTSPYHELEHEVTEADTQSFLSAPGPEEVGEAIVAAVDSEGPLHVLVGDEARGAHAAAAGLTFEEWAEVLATGDEAI